MELVTMAHAHGRRLLARVPEVEIEKVEATEGKLRGRIFREVGILSLKGLMGASTPQSRGSERQERERGMGFLDVIIGISIHHPTYPQIITRYYSVAKRHNPPSRSGA
jgi:hypothetical protein